MIDLLMDQQMIKYAKHLSGQRNNTNFCTSSRLDSQEELFEFCVSPCPNNSMRYFNDHATIGMVVNTGSEFSLTMSKAALVLSSLPVHINNRYNWYDSAFSHIHVSKGVTQRKQNSASFVPNIPCADKVVNTECEYYIEMNILLFLSEYLLRIFPGKAFLNQPQESSIFLCQKLSPVFHNLL